MKKWFSILFTLLLTASMLSGCGGNNSATDSDDTTASGEKAVGSNSSEVTGDIMIYTSAEDAFISEVCDMFNRRYPKANAQYYRSGTEEVISKIMAEKMTNSLQADLIMVSDAPTFESLKANDLLQPYDSPEIDNIYTEFVDPEHYYYGTFPAAMGIAYNTNLVTEAPTSWLDLLSENAKGNTVMPNPLYGQLVLKRWALSFTTIPLRDTPLTPVHYPRSCASRFWRWCFCIEVCRPSCGIKWGGTNNEYGNSKYRYGLQWFQGPQ